MNRRIGISLFVLVTAAIAAVGILIVPTMIQMNQSSSLDVYPETDPEGTERRVLNIGTDFIKDSPTFKFDGIEETLELEQVMIRETSPLQYVLTYNFNSRYAGYGDRLGQVVADVITIHRAVIILTVELVENGASYEIDAAHIDGRWNILEQEFFPQKGLATTPALEKAIKQTWSPGWNDLTQTLDFQKSEVIFNHPDSTSKLDINYILKGADPNRNYHVGIHLFWANSRQCVGSFGQFTALPFCQLITKQGKSRVVEPVELGVLTTDSDGNGIFVVNIEAISAGTYEVQFHIRTGVGCLPINCAIIFQSPGPFGITTFITIP